MTDFEALLTGYLVGCLLSDLTMHPELLIDVDGDYRNAFRVTGEHSGRVVVVTVHEVPR